jgi:glycosyltransferase involved in cell wall biosynthesis
LSIVSNSYKNCEVKKLRIWLITIGEPLPIDGDNERLYRTGILANLLVSKGHEVVWWTSTFNHTRKKQRFNTDTSIDINDCFKIKLLHSVTYTKNVSISRIINHYMIARKFSKLARLESQPDIILCSFPTMELSLAATRYGKERNVPVVIDVRDLWPDIFIDLFPKRIRWLVKVALFVFLKNTRKVFGECSSIISISDGYLQWGLSYSGRKRNINDAVFPLCYKKPDVNDNQLKSAKFALRNIGVESSKIICWFVGMFGKTYDLSTVINAAHQLDKQGINNVQFVLSGDGENYSKWFKQAQGLSNVVFTGWVDFPQIAYLMRIADIGLAAYAEGAPQGLPNKIFEYLCAGIPILSSLKGETEALLSNNKCGLTYNAVGTEDFLEKLFILINDKDLRKKMSSNSASLFKSCYSTDKVYACMVNFLEGLSQSYVADLK